MNFSRDQSISLPDLDTYYFEIACRRWPGHQINLLSSQQCFD